MFFANFKILVFLICLQVKPIEIKNLILLINEYLLRTTDLLNVFATKMEDEILKIDRRLDSLECQFIFVEKKVK